MAATSNASSSGDVSEIASVEIHVLNDWVKKGVVTPAVTGDGPGSHRRYTLMQAVGVAVAAHVYRSERGCVLGYVGAVFSVFAAADEAWLKKQFAAGRTHLACIHDGGIVLRGKQYDWVDVGAIHRDVLAKVAEIAARPVSASAGGRKRGLAASGD